MATDPIEKTRSEKLVEKIMSQKDIIDSANKGELIINFAGKSNSVSIKIFVD